jgi:hypothetical protein
VQPLDPIGVYTPAAVKAELLFGAGDRELTFRFDHLDSGNAYLGPLSNVLGGTVDNNYLADIKRSATFNIQDDGSINFIRDRIKPWARLAMPDGGYVEWPLGVFLLSTPARTLTAGGSYIKRTVQGYDQLLILRDNAVTDRYAIASGTAYTTAIATLATAAGIVSTNITASAATLPATMEWDPGTTYLRIINDLLAAINYESASFDEVGKFIAKPYVSPTARASDFTYATDASSVIADGIDQTLDLFSVPNVFVLVKSEPDQATLRSVYTNASPTSPTSTVNRGRSIATVIAEQDAPDQTTLDAKAARAASDASQVYEEVEFDSAIMPMHGTNDVLTFQADGLAISTQYAEHEWSFPLKAGEMMHHKIRRVVTV